MNRKHLHKKKWHLFESEIIKRRKSGESILKIARDLNLGEGFVKVICRGNKI